MLSETLQYHFCRTITVQISGTLDCRAYVPISAWKVPMERPKCDGLYPQRSSAFLGNCAGVTQQYLYMVMVRSRSSKDDRPMKFYAGIVYLSCQVQHHQFSFLSFKFTSPGQSAKWLHWCLSYINRVLFLTQVLLAKRASSLITMVYSISQATTISAPKLNHVPKSSFTNELARFIKKS